MSKRASRNRKRFSDIEAAAPPASFKICGTSEPLEILAADGGDGIDAAGQAKPKKFSMVAYTGGAMEVGFGYPVVVDLEGGRLASPTTPVFRNHNPERIVGHGGAEITSQRIRIAGVMSGDPEEVEPIVASSRRGFPWQASIGATVQKREFVEAGQKVKVNGRNFTGPIVVARQWTLGEISFVPIGADTSTSASVAASSQAGVASMDPKLVEALQAEGFAPDQLTDAKLAKLKAMFTPAAAPVPAPAPKVEAAQPTPSVHSIRAIEAEEEAAIKASNARVAANLRRREDIARVCAKYDHPRWTESDGTEMSLEEKAITANWDERETHLQALLKHRGTGAPNFFMASQKRDHEKPDVLECSLSMSRNLPNIEKQYKPETLEAAHKHFRNFGLQQLFLTAAAANGYHCGPGHKITNGNLREVLHAAFGSGGIRAAGFSTVPLPNILGNVANKELLAGYMEEDMTWREVAGIKTVSNFHAVTSYRMLDDMSYEKLGPSGEIVHGKVSEESYTRQADTYAKMFALTRRDLVNDDLGAFDDLRNRLGRGSAQKFNDVFWTEFLSDASTFWTAARTNYITGATTTLLTDGVGLAAGVKAFRQMVTPTADGSKRIAGRPEILLVPPELEYAADNLFMGEKINVGSGPGDRNIYANKYRPVVSAWLSDSNFTGYSATAWYLLRSPSIAPAVVVSFLNGMQTPTVESAEADFNTLGVQFRGYHDFGVDQAEYLAGIKSKGAA